MLIGVVSDTHGHLGFTQEATQVLADQKIETVLHCGDIGSLEIVPLFDRWTTHFVFGNVDHNDGDFPVLIYGEGCAKTPFQLIGSAWPLPARWELP